VIGHRLFLSFVSARKFYSDPTSSSQLTSLSREFLCAGDKLLFREGRTKGLGIVTATGFDKNKFPNAMTEERDSKAVTEKKGAKAGASTIAATTTTTAKADPKVPTKTGAVGGAKT
jgi:hypothetical protein